MSSCIPCAGEMQLPASMLCYPALSSPCFWCADAKSGRQLLQATSNPISNFTLSVMVTKCSGTQAVDQASVAALVNGYTATNLKIPLSPTISNPSLYSGEPDLAACVSCAVICFCHARGETCGRRSANPDTSLAMPALP